MDTWVRVPKSEGAEDFATFLLETLEKAQSFGVHSVEVREDGAKGGEYAAWDMETGEYDDRLERALLALITYAAEICEYTLPPLGTNHEEGGD